MSGNSIGREFRVTTWGESHGKAIGVVIDGCPPNLRISEAAIQSELNRRRPGRSPISSSRGEDDRVEILSGIFNGKTTGTPISLIVYNKDIDSEWYEKIKHIPRPGQADLTYLMKYGIRDYRGGGRASGRETVARVAAGAVAKLILRREGISVFGHVIEAAGISLKRDVSIDEIMKNTGKNLIMCADLDTAREMMDSIMKITEEGDSSGGKFELIATGVPPGLGEPVFDKLDAEIAKALMSIGAVKAVEIGKGVDSSLMRGSEMNDQFFFEGNRVITETNNSGGILGGISTGMPIRVRVTVKPTPTIEKKQRSVDITKERNTLVEGRGRHDPNVTPRALIVGEAMLSIVLVDHLLRNRKYKHRYKRNRG